MLCRILPIGEIDKSVIVRKAEGISSARFTMISPDDKGTRKVKRTKKNAKELLIESASRPKPFLSAKQVSDLEDFAGVQPGYGDRKAKEIRKKEEVDQFKRRAYETKDEHVARVKRLIFG